MSRSSPLAWLFGLFAALGSAAVVAQDPGAGEPQRGGTLVVSVNAEQRTLNPAIRASTGVYVFTGKIVEPLVDLSYDGIVPVLATEWSSSEDGKTITFKLREGVFWHDGEPFSSADVAYTAMNAWKEILNYGSTLQANLESVDTPDEHTVVFNYSQPMPMDLLLRSMPDLGHPLPRHLFEGTDIPSNPYSTAPVGTGPFVFKEYERGQYIIAERNPNYWRGEQYPYLDQVVWRFIEDRSASAAALEAEQVHLAGFMGVPLADMARLAEDERFSVGTQGYEGNMAHTVLEMNLRSEPLSHKTVRHAIAHALDIDFVVENIFLGYGAPGTGLIPSNAGSFYTDDVPMYPYDTAKAEALLDEAGYPRVDGGMRFPLRLRPAPWGEYTNLFGEYVAQALKQVGIDVTIVPNDAATFLRSVYKDHDFDLSVGWHQFRNDPAVSTTVWLRSGAPVGTPWSNQYGYLNPELDQLIDAAASELDPQRRAELYHQIQRIAKDDLPVLFAVEHPFVSVTNNVVQNHHNTPRWMSSSWWDTWLDDGQ